MPFKIVRNDITKVKADVIVNTANPNPICASGTDLAIYEAAGKEKLLAERANIGKIARGDIAVTGAYNLKAKYIIHTVGPVWTDGLHHEFEILEDCYRKSLQKALELKCESIAFPLISTGVYGFPKPELIDFDGDFRVNMYRKVKGEFGVNGATTQTTQTHQTTQSKESTLSDDDKKILELVHNYPSMSQREYANKLGWNLDRVKYYLRKMKTQNLIKRVGSSHSGYWEVLVDLT